MPAPNQSAVRSQRRRRRLALAALAAASLAITVAGPPTTAGSGEAGSAGRGGPVPFDARGLVALSDADTVAQAYINDRIGPPITDRDTLTLIRPGVLGPVWTREAKVTNSVWGPPTTVATTPDGRYAIALEAKEQREPGDVSFEADLPFTTRITVVDLRGPKPRMVQTADTGGFAAHSLSISPSGDYVAVANWAAPGEDSGIPEGQGQQISIMPFAHGRLGPPQLFGMDNIPGEFVFPNTIAWHRSGKYLAVTVGPRNLVAFYRVARSEGDRLSVRPWGSPVEAGQFPFPGTWSPNGRFFIAGTMEWSEPEVSDRNSPPGRLSVVSFDGDREGGVDHEVHRGARVGINPEGLAISPDGRYVVTVNLRYSHLPNGFNPRRPPTTSSMTLTTFDQQTGESRRVAEYTFDAILPEGVVFDRTGEHLAVAVFDFNGAKAGQGAVQFWRLHRGDRPRLEQLEYEIPTVRGTHSLSVIP